MADTNLQLLPERRKSIDISRPGENRPMVWAVTLIIIVGVLYAVTVFYNNSVNRSIDNVNNRLRDLEARRDKANEENLLLINKRLSVAAPLLNSHIFWSEAFQTIQSAAQPEVSFVTLDTKVQEKKMTIKALAPNYPTIARQIASFTRQDAFQKLSLDKVQSLPTGNIEFNIRLDFDPELLLRKTAEK